MNLSQCLALPDDAVDKSPDTTDDGQVMDSPRPVSKVKRKQKAVARNRSQKNRKSKKGGGKRQATLAQTTKTMSNALRFVTECHAKYNTGDRSTVPTECQDCAHEISLQLTHTSLDEADMVRSLPSNETISALKNKYIGASTIAIAHRKLLTLEETEQKLMRLKEKLRHDTELDITGVLNLSSMNLTDFDLPLIIQGIFYNGQKNCTGLILRDNSLSSDGVKTLVDDLLVMKTNLRCLCLSSNCDLGDASVKHVVRFLQGNRSLTVLALLHTSMTDAGVRLLADALCGVQTDVVCAPLEILDISFNKSITDSSLEALLEIAERNRTLKTLSLQHCSLSVAGAQQLRAVNMKNKSRNLKPSG